MSGAAVIGGPARPKGAATTDLVLVVAGTSWDGIWMPERHVARHLAERVQILWVDPPISYLTPLLDRGAIKSLRAPRLREVAPNTMRLSPVTAPGVSRPVLREVTTRQTRRAIRKAVATLGARVLCTIVASPSDMLDVVPTGRRVFYGTDDFVAGARLTGTDSEWLERATDRQLKHADTVIAVSPGLEAKWSSRRPDISLIPNGCETSHFERVDEAPEPTDVLLPRPIAGFVGHMSDRIDVAMLEAVAATGASLLLVGPRQPTYDISKLDSVLACPNVQWVGGKSFESLPSYLRCIDVGLTPYGHSDFNHASFPLKTLEYLAAGRQVVATDLASHRWLDTPLITIASTPAEFADRTLELLRSPRRDEDADARRAFASRHSWEERTAAIARLLELDGAPAPPPEGLP